MKAAIYGRHEQNVLQLPRSALWTVGNVRHVQIVKREGILISIDSGPPEPGDKEINLRSVTQAALGNLLSEFNVTIAAPKEGKEAHADELLLDYPAGMAVPVFVRQAAEQLASPGVLPSSVKRITVGSLNRLDLREVDVLRTQKPDVPDDPDVVIIRSGVKPGELISISSIENPMPDMLLRILGETFSIAPAQRDGKSSKQEK